MPGSRVRATGGCPTREAMAEAVSDKTPLLMEPRYRCGKCGEVVYSRVSPHDVRKRMLTCLACCKMWEVTLRAEDAAISIYLQEQA